MVEATLTKEVERDLEALIRGRLGKAAVRDVRFVGMTRDGDDLKLLIEVEIAEGADTRALARAYLGLTTAVRRAMGDRLADVFPNIVPTFGREMHA